MEYLIGAGLAVAVSVFAMLAGFDRERVFYPTVLAVIATYYILFAVMGGSANSLAWEVSAAAVFLLLATVGFRRSLWITAAALVAHGVFDCVHGRLIENPGVPAWWPGFCLAYDIVAGGVLVLLLVRRPGLAASSAR